MAQSWPSKPIRAFIPFAAGSATDIVPRALFEPLGAELGQSIVVENRGGAGGTLGIGAVVRADPDGYSILANSSAHTIAPWIVPNFPFDLAKDLSGALMIGQNANILIASPAKGWKTVQELVAAAKAKPGSTNYGSDGVGTATQIAAETFRAAGFEAVHIAYKGGAEALADTVAGRIDFYYCPISTALPFIEDKRVVALAASTATRAPELPDVPTSLEAGYPNSDLTIWYGVFMPSKTAREIVDKFHSTAMRVLTTPTMQQRMKQLAINPMPMAPTEMDKYVATELGTNERLIKAAGIK
jgi:tripartite-type tricarboxylate transporter receptor subunit TctC